MQQKKVNTAIVALSVLLAVSVTSLAGLLVYKAVTAPKSTTTVVSDNILTQETEASSVPETVPSSSGPDSSTEPQPTVGTTRGTVPQTVKTTISLHNRNTDDNVPFQSGNMFPGDNETAYYCVRVSHKGDVILRFRADIRPGYEKLSEVLGCRVVLPESGEVLYDGLMRDMPDSVNRPLNADKPTVSDVAYEITAYLDTSVGNEYMNKDLVADFRWWVEETENTDSPQTGESFSLYLWLCIASGASLLLILLLKKCKKEDAANEG